MVKMIDVQDSHCTEAAKSACAQYSTTLDTVNNEFNKLKKTLPSLTGTALSTATSRLSDLSKQSTDLGSKLNDCMVKERTDCVNKRNAYNEALPRTAAHNDWGMTPTVENIMGDDAFSFDMVSNVPSASAIATACDASSPDMQRRGESFVPVGWGPYCNPSQERGTAEAQICFGNLYLKAYQKCLLDQLDTMRDLGETETAKSDQQNAYNYGSVKNSNRGKDGIAYATPATDPSSISGPAQNMKYASGQNVSIGDCFPDATTDTENNRDNPFVDCMCTELSGAVTTQDAREPTQYEKPLTSTTTIESEDASSTGEENTNTNVEQAVADAIGTKYDKCLEKLAETSPDGDTASTQDATNGFDLDNKGFPPPGGAELGIDKYAVERCACMNCMVVKDHSDTIDGDTTSASDTPASDTTNTSTDTTNEESTTEDSPVIPLAFGVNVVSGVVLDFDENQFKACRSTLRYYTAKFRLARNKQSAVTRIFHDDIDVSDQVTWQVRNDNEGATVTVFNIPSSWAASSKSIKLAFETVEDYDQELAADVFLQTSALYTRAVVRPDHNRIYAVNNVSKQLTFINYTTFEVEADDYVIPDDTLFFVAPTGDIVTRVSGSTSITIYSHVAKRTKTIDNIFPSTTTKLYFTNDGWYDYKDDMPYQYDDFRGNPVIDYEDWFNLSNVRRMGSAYLIHASAGGGFTTQGQQYESVIVPAHAADIDLARKHVRHFSRVSSITNCIGAYNDDTRELRTLVKRHNALYLEFFEFPKQYPVKSVLNTDTTGKVYDETGDVNVAALKIEVPNLYPTTPITVFASQTYRQICVINHTTKKAYFYLYDTRVAYTWTYSYLGNGYNTSQQLMHYNASIVDIPLPASPTNYVNVIDKDVYYISTAHEIVKLDVHNRNYTIVGTVNEPDTITWQEVSDAGEITYGAGGKIKKCLVYSPTSFDVAKAVQRMMNFFDQECEVTQAVPSYLRGFTVADDVDLVIENLCKMTTLMVHRHNGDGTTICRNRTVFDIAEYPTYETFNAQTFSSNAPAVYVSAIDAETGLREGVMMVGDNETDTSFKTGANTHDLYAVATNVQVHLTDKNNYIQTYVSLGNGIEAEFDLIDIDPASNKIRIEHTNVEGQKLVPPTNATPSLPISRVSPPTRPIYTNIYNIDDLATAAFGYFVSSDTMELHNFTIDLLTKLKTKEYVIFGVRNMEKIYVQNVVDQGGGVYKLVGVRRGADNTDVIIKYNGNRNDGLFVIIPNYGFNQEYNKFVTLKQMGVDVTLPVSRQALRYLPPPINLRARDGKITWHTRTSEGTGDFILIFWWSEWRDREDARYVFNSVQKHGFDYMFDNITHFSNRFMYMTKTEGANEVDIPTPPEPTPFGDTFTLYNYTRYGNSELYQGFSQGWYLPQYAWDGYGKYGFQHWMPKVSQIPNVEFFSTHYDDLWYRISLPPKYDYHKGGDKANRIMKLQDLPNLVTIPDYWGNTSLYGGAVAAKFDQPPGAYYTDLPEGFDTGTGFDPSLGYTITYVTPLRAVLELFLFPSQVANRDGIVDSMPSYKSDQDTRNKYRFWDDPLYAGASFKEDFMERLTVVYLLLDQYHLGIPIPNERYELLGKYGVAPPYSIKVHDPNGVKTTAFLNDTIFNYSPYPPLGGDGKLNVLIAEKQADGKYGHFEVFEGVPIEVTGGPTCGKTTYVEKDGINSWQQSAYVIIEASVPRLLRFSITYAIAPFVPFTVSNKAHKVTQYVVMNKIRARNIAQTAYAILNNNPFAVRGNVGYAVIAPA